MDDDVGGMFQQQSIELLSWYVFFESAGHTIESKQIAIEEEKLERPHAGFPCTQQEIAL